MPGAHAGLGAHLPSLQGAAGAVSGHEVLVHGEQTAADMVSNH